MSGSPKVSEIELREAEERKLRAQRRLLAEQERRRREEAERRARVALANQFRKTIAEEAGQLRAEIAALRSEAHSSGQGLDIAHIEREIEDAYRRSGDTPDSLALALAKVRTRSAQIATSRKAFAEQAQNLVAGQSDILREAAAESARLAKVAQKQETEHRRLALTLALGLRARVAGVEADEIAMAWSADAVMKVAEAIDGLEAAQDPSVLARELQARLDRALDAAQERQLAEERRAYIISALQDGLRKLGFQVSDPVVVGVDLAGEVAFRAARTDRRWIEVNVPLEGHVFYDVDNDGRVEEPGDDGTIYSACEGAEARLEALHEDLSQRFGVVAGELIWEGKNPNKRQKGARSLPSGGSSKTRDRG